MEKHQIIATIAVASLFIAIYDTSAAIYVALLANVYSNYVNVERTKKKKNTRRTSSIPKAPKL